MPSKEVASKKEIEEAGNDLVVLNFWADWCPPCVQLNAIFDQLADSYPTVKFFKIEAEKFEELTDTYEVTAVPSFVFIKNQKPFDKIEGANSPQLADKVDKYSQIKDSAVKTQSQPVDPKVALRSRLEKLINFAPVMLFMKGTPSNPQCGFSNKIVELLKSQDILFDSFNILSDEEVRQGLKEYSNWPTFPQLYIDGKLIGGLDIIKEMVEEGELKGMVPEKALKKDLNTKLKEIINQKPVMLFMKGNPEEPKCGFSRKIVEILNTENIQFGSFDILQDEEVRQGLKTFSNWPTYPQLYSKGKLIGGLDIVKELAADGELKESLE